MKRIVTSAFTVVLLLGLGTGVMAASDDIACKVRDFKEMLPFMQENHPELSEKELKDMHKDCVGKMKKEPSAPCMMNQ
ncbi:hypothetical protein [Neobacillus niacini]|uniref:hypothetical protein n=1 Tax=Neobacillus niacini TaxID=86668 RepID=UPI0005F000A0|nr:hypothetical protein [Neobacillus niacini]